jgi:hypothetical protein
MLVGVINWTDTHSGVYSVAMSRAIFVMSARAIVCGISIVKAFLFFEATQIRYMVAIVNPHSRWPAEAGAVVITER